MQDQEKERSSKAKIKSLKKKDQPMQDQEKEGSNKEIFEKWIDHETKKSSQGSMKIENAKN